jgi:hemerythrin-like domain-containing protein
MRTEDTRREFLKSLGMIGAGVTLAGCGSGAGPQSAEKKKASQAAGIGPGGEVTATEDLMREHGVLRRALLVYSAAATRLRGKAASVPPAVLQKTAQLFRAFGEEYHEKLLEEAHIFPAVKRAGGPAAAYLDTLIAQHRRGREITDHFIAATKGAKRIAGKPEAFARALESFVLMYRNHAAREDTVVFPAWKQALTAQQLDEIGDKFEEIEHLQFGADGFGDAVKQIGEIEASLGLSDIAKFTAPPPPKL